MNSKHRIVHLISFFAILIGFFSPILSWPVTAETDPPEPDVTLSTPDDIDPTSPGGQDAPPNEPVLIPVVPVAPVIEEASCGEGGVYANTASALQTEGVHYEIGVPDAEGNFIVTATLTDDSAYRWADSGLEGWVVSGNQATTGGSLVLCPLPDPEEEEEFGDVDDLDTEAGNADAVSGDDQDASGRGTEQSASTPKMMNRSGVVQSTSDALRISVEVSYPSSYDVAVPGDQIVYNVTITNQGTAPIEDYDFFIRAGDTELLNYVAWQYGPGRACWEAHGEGTTGYRCELQATGTLEGNQSDVFEFRGTVASVSPALCNNGVQVSIYPGIGFEGDPAEPLVATHIPVNCADVEVFIDGPDSVVQGEEALFTVTYKNISYYPQRGPLLIKFTHPSTFDLLDGHGCAIGGLGGPNTLTCEFTDSLAAGEEGQATFTVKAQEGTSENCGPQTFAAWGVMWQGAPSEKSASTLINCGVLSLSKTDNVAISVEENSPFRYRVRITNNSNLASGPYTFTDTLPLGVVLHGDTPITAPAGSECNHEPVDGRTMITCSGDDVPTNSSDSHNYLFNVVASYLVHEDACWDVTNTATGTFGQWSEEGRSSSTDVFVECIARLKLDFSADKEQVEPGDTITYTASVINTGGGISNGYELNIHLPNHLSVEEGSLSFGDGAISCTGSQTIACNAGGLLSSVHTVEYTVVVPMNFESSMCGEMASVIEKLYGQFDSMEQMTQNVTLQCPMLTLAKTDGLSDGESVRLNEPFTYTVTLMNTTGDSSKGYYEFEDELPRGLVLVGDDAISSPDGASCTTATTNGITTITCSGTEVPIGEDGIDFAFTVMAVDLVEGVVDGAVCDGITNIVSGTEGVWLGGGRDASVETDVNCISNVEYSMEPVQSPIVPGEPISFVHSFHNTGDTRIEAMLLDNLQNPDLPSDAEWTVEYEINGVRSQMPPSIQTLESGGMVKVFYTSPAVPDDLTMPESRWCTSWSSSAVAQMGFSDGTELSMSDSASVQVNCTGLSIEQTVSSSVIPVGGEVEFTITVTNLGNTTVSPLEVVHDASETGGVFSNWRVQADDALDCGLTEDANPACQYLTLDRGESIQLTVTGDAPEVPTWQQCGPVESVATFVYGEAWAPMSAQVDLSPPYTLITSNSVTVQLDCEPGITIEKQAEINPGDNDRADAGDTITYSIDVTNIGNVQLYDVTVTTDLSHLEWDGDLTVASLLPGETETFTAAYTIRQQDIDSGAPLVSNASVIAFVEPIDAETFGSVHVLGMAMSQGSPNLPVSVTDTASTEITLVQVADIHLEVTSDADEGPGAGDIITYFFTVTNTGNVTLTDIEVIPDLEGLVFTEGNRINELAPSDVVVILATYEVTEEDVISGAINVCADAIATGEISDTEVCLTVAVQQPVSPTPDPATPDPATPAPVGQETPRPITELPTTGAGGAVSIASILWAAVVLMLGTLGFGVRKRIR